MPSDALALGGRARRAGAQPVLRRDQDRRQPAHAATTRASQLMKPYPALHRREPLPRLGGRLVVQRVHRALHRSSSTISASAVLHAQQAGRHRPASASARGAPRSSTRTTLSKSKAVAEDDRTHVITGHFIWQLPFGKDRRWANYGWLADVVGQWRLSGSAPSPPVRPLVITGITTSNGVSTGSARTPSCIGDPKLPEGQQTLDHWFNNEKDPAKGAAFAQPDPFTFGTGKRTYPEVRGPKVEAPGPHAEPHPAHHEDEPGAAGRGAERLQHAAVRRAGQQPSPRGLRPHHHRRRGSGGCSSGCVCGSDRAAARGDTQMRHWVAVLLACALAGLAACRTASVPGRGRAGPGAGAVPASGPEVDASSTGRQAAVRLPGLVRLPRGRLGVGALEALVPARSAGGRQHRPGRHVARRLGARSGRAVRDAVHAARWQPRLPVLRLQRRRPWTATSGG